MRIRRSHSILWLALWGLVVSGFPLSSAPLPGAGRALAPPEAASLGALPVAFEPNHGQVDPEVRFLTRGTNHTVFLTATGWVLSLAAPEGQPPTVVTIDLVGANPDPAMEGLDLLEGRVNYLLGNDPAEWRVDIPTFARVVYRQVYPGIDLVWHGSQGVLEYDFVVAPGADPTVIATTVTGADSLALDDTGALLLTVPGGEVRLGTPVVFQDIDGVRVPVEGHFAVTGNRVGFEVPDYDTSWPLIIDPTVVYSTYFGGDGNADTGNGIAVDKHGHAYVAGSTNSPGFPKHHPCDLPCAFVVKLNQAGNGMVFLTVFGGNGTDVATAIAVHDRRAYVAGVTSSNNFPVSANPFQPGPAAPGDEAFVVKLKKDGDGFEYSTYLGGTGDEAATGIAVDKKGHAYVAGHTNSDDFPLENEAMEERGAPTFTDAFVAKLSKDGSTLVYSTYVGGTDGNDAAEGIAVDSKGHAYIAGWTLSSNFPTDIVPFGEDNANVPDAFVTKLSQDGDELVYSTYLGGTGDDFALGVAVDGKGNAHVVGVTMSDDFPTEFAVQENRAGLRDAFVTKFNKDGDDVVYSTYLGGANGEDSAWGIALDGKGNAHVVGVTDSDDFRLQNEIQGFGGGLDAFVAKVRSNGTLVYSTYLGGAGDDIGLAVAADRHGKAAYVTGETSSANFPTNNPLQPTLAPPANDAFVSKITP